MPEAYQITPTVDQTQEFIEIANDFSNPLELVREAMLLMREQLSLKSCLTWFKSRARRRFASF
jgi:hypothetical protein